MAFHKIAYLFVALTFVLASCQSKKQSLYKTWFYAYNNTSEKGIQGGQELTPENFIDLQRDGIYASYLSEFEYGNWNVEGRLIQLQNHKGDKKTIKIISGTGGELTLDLTPGSQNGNSYVFTGISNKKTEGENNPFSKENNKWRIRSPGPETSEEIKARLINHFKYWESYFEWAVANDLETLDVSSKNSPLELYGNGFKLIPYEELSEVWKSNFFNEEDCREAWNKLKTMMDTRNISWPKTENRFLLFISAFQQLQGMVD